MRVIGRGLAAGLLGAMLLAAPAGAAGELQIKVLSNRADVISAGDALVAVNLPAGVSAGAVTVKRDGTDVSDQFAMRPNGRFEGLLTGLRIGRNVVTATAGKKTGTLTITNHPNGGPVFSGPQVQPWVCQSGAADAQ